MILLKKSKYNLLKLALSINSIKFEIDKAGTQYWWKNYRLHRDNDMPAVIYVNGEKSWYKNGQYHRENDLPALIFSNGAKRWFKHGEEYTPTTNENN